MLPGIRTVAVFAALVAAQAASTQEFVWRIGPRVIGRLKVPTGFQLELRSYREGILTTLRYPDGAYLVLQCGGMYRIPMLQGAGHVLNSSRQLEGKTIRLGQLADSDLFWREDDYTPGQPATPHEYPPNLAYDKVPPARRAEFDRALDSFEREIERPAGSGR